MACNAESSNGCQWDLGVRQNGKLPNIVFPPYYSSTKQLHYFDILYNVILAQELYYTGAQLPTISQLADLVQNRWHRCFMVLVPCPRDCMYG